MPQYNKNILKILPEILRNIAGRTAFPVAIRESLLKGDAQAWLVPWQRNEVVYLATLARSRDAFGVGMLAQHDAHRIRVR